MLYSSFRFTLSDMMRYFEHFDPVLYRFDEVHGLNDDIIQQIKSYIQPQVLRISDEFTEYELYQDLGLIYGTDEPIVQYIDIINLIRKKLISEYLNIDGLGRLFNVKYFQYEWDMHMNINYNAHTQSYYRDHFIHQVKDAYECMVLLDKLNLLENMRENIMSSNTNTSDYLQSMINSEFYQIKCNNTYYEIYSKIFDGLPDGNVNTAVDSETRDKLIRKNTINNILKSVLIIAGLFHDISYPILHEAGRQDKLSAYLPIAHYFLHSSYSFQQLRAQLSTSLLFSVFSEKAIKSAYETAGSDHNDHGMLSALALLLFFYHNGIIHGLTPTKRAAIEMAALVIADHTIIWKVIDKKGTDYYDMVNYRNPASFLLRFCDDLQEWGRMYFYMSKYRTMRVCQSCKLPILDCEEWLGPKTRPAVFHRTRCGCSDFNQSFPERPAVGDATAIGGQWMSVVRNDYEKNSTGHFVISDMKYRRLNHIKACDIVRFIRMPVLQPEKRSGLRSYFLFLPRETLMGLQVTPAPSPSRPMSITENDTYLVHVDYNLFSLLQTTFMGDNFAKFRSDDLNKVKVLIQNSVGFPNIVIHSDITNNPVTLKVKIIERFLSNASARCERILEEFVSLALEGASMFGGCGDAQEIYGYCEKKRKEIFLNWAACFEGEDNKLIYAHPNYNEDTIDKLFPDQLFPHGKTLKDIAEHDKENIDMFKWINVLAHNNAFAERAHFFLQMTHLLLDPNSTFTIDEIETALEPIFGNRAEASQDWVSETDENPTLIKQKEPVLIPDTELRNVILGMNGVLSELRAWLPPKENTVFPTLDLFLQAADVGYKMRSLDLYQLKINAIDIQSFINKFQDILTDSCQKLFDPSFFMSCVASIYTASLKNNMAENINMYIKLLTAEKLLLAFLDQAAFIKENSAAKDKINDSVHTIITHITNVFLDELLISNNKNPVWRHSIEDLLLDFFEQVSKQLRHYDGTKPVVENGFHSEYKEDCYWYANSYKNEKRSNEIASAIGEYVRSSHYRDFLKCKRGQSFLDSQADLYFFYRLSRASQSKAYI